MERSSLILSDPGLRRPPTREPLASSPRSRSASPPPAPPGRLGTIPLGPPGAHLVAQLGPRREGSAPALRPEPVARKLPNTGLRPGRGPGRGRGRGGARAGWHGGVSDRHPGPSLTLALVQTPLGHRDSTLAPQALGPGRDTCACVERARHGHGTWCPFLLTHGGHIADCQEGLRPPPPPATWLWGDTGSRVTPL